jgi:lipoprotein-anchoring transpeptidase ErfK/SrfK
MRALRGPLLTLTALALAAVAPASSLGAPAGTHVAAFDVPSFVSAGERVEVTGRIAPAIATDVSVERLNADATAWEAVVNLRTDRRGKFAATLPFRTSINLRVTVAGDDGSLTASRNRFVALRRSVAVSVRPALYETIATRPHLVTGRVRPARPGETVVLEGSRNGGAYAPLTRMTAGSGGAVKGRFSPPNGGVWRYRMSVAARKGLDAGGSAVTPPTKVFASNPHSIPANASHYIVQAIGETQLYYYEDGRLLRVLPVVFGKASTPSPVGRFAVYSKTTGPGAAFGPLVLWYHRGYGIHGTNQEYLLKQPPRYYSHGCTRNYNANILWLWPRVPVGTPVLNLAP